MCTLAVSVGQHPEWPLIVAANRDEALDRRSSPPFLWEGDPAFFAPRDEQAGGTWLGLNAAGLFVAITNRFAAPRHPLRASRGRLVVDALGHRTIDSLHASLAQLDPQRFNAFHLLYTDGRDVGITWTDGETLHQLWPGPGLHVLSERSFGAADAPRDGRVRAAWPTALVGGEPDLAALKSLLSMHDDGDPLAAPCVHVPAFNYGTRSALILLKSRDPHRTRLMWAEGPPCRTSFESVDARIA